MKKDTHNLFRTSLKLGIILLFIITTFSSINSGVYVDTSVEFEIDSPLETYTFAEPMDFSQIIIASTYIVFNTTGFNVTSTTTIDIQIDDIVDDVLLPSTVDEELVSFTTVNTPSATWFNVSGFYPSVYYNVSKNGAYYNTYQANSTGSISIYDADPGASPYIISANGSAYNPVVTTTGEAAGITNNSAILYADLVYDGGEACEVWIEYGVNTSYGSNSSYNATKTTGGEFLYNFGWDIQNPSLSDDSTDLIRTDKNAIGINKQRIDCYGNIEVNYINYSLTKRYTGDDYDIQATFLEYAPSMTNYSETIVNTSSISTYTDVDWFNFKFNPPIQLVDIHEDNPIHTYGFFVYGAHSIYNDLSVYTSRNDKYEYGAYHDVISGDYNYDMCFIINNGTSYSTNLSAGQLYHYRAVANNTNTTAYGSDAAFLTLPNVTRDPVARDEIDQINLTWTAGDGANNTYIERNATGTTSWSRGAGTIVYNDTGTTYIDTSLSIETTYYYQLWSFTNWTNSSIVYHQFSSVYNTTSATTDLVDPPYNGTSDYNTTSQNVTLTWTRGNYSDREIVVQNNNTWATSPTDGWVRYNDTAETWNGSQTTSTYFTVWSYNDTSNVYSTTGLNIPWGAIRMQCYDESNSTGLTFDVLITNEDLETLYLKNLTNAYYVDLNDIPFGDATIFYVSSDDYESRTYYYDLTVNTFYNLTFYLPFSMPPDGGDPENETYSHLYRFIVVNEIDQTLEDAKIQVLRYINASDEWLNVSILFTDANGQADVYLLAGQGVFYNIRISKDKYITQTSEFIPDPDYYGAYYPKTFRLIREAVELPEIVTGFDIITWDAYFLSGDNTTLYVDYADSTGNTTTGNIRIYQNGTTLSYTYNFTGNFSITWTSGNHTLHDYKVVLNITGHPDITGGDFSDIWIIERYYTPDEVMFDRSWALEVDFVDVLGENPMGWVNLIVFFLGLVVVVSVGKQWAGLGIIGLGAILFVVQRVMGLPGFTLVQLAVIPFFILYGFLVIIARNKKEVRI